MIDFRFCRFYGISAPLAVLMSDTEFDNVLNSVNSVSGFSLMKSLELELKFLHDNLINGKVIQTELDYDKLFDMGYGEVVGVDKPQGFRRTIVKIRKHFNTKPNEVYKLDNGRSLTKKQWEVAEVDFDLVGRRVSRMVTLGERFELSDLAYKALSLIYEMAMRPTTSLGRVVPKIVELQDKIVVKVKENTIDKQTLYGDTLNDLQSIKNLYVINQRVNRRYSEEFSGLGRNNLKHPIEVMQGDLNRLKNVEKKEVRDPIPLSMLIRIDYNDKYLNLYRKLEDCMVDGDIVNYTNRSIKLDDLELFKLVYDGPNKEEAINDLNIYMDIEKFMETINTFNIGYFGQIFQEKDLALDKLEETFNTLTDIGVVGLNMHLKEFFKEALKTTSLDSKVDKHADLESNELVTENINMMLEDLASKKKYTEGGVVL